MNEVGYVVCRQYKREITNLLTKLKLPFRDTFFLFTKRKRKKIGKNRNAYFTVINTFQIMIFSLSLGHQPILAAEIDRN